MQTSSHNIVILPKSKYLLAASRLRTQLINNILTGKIRIDQNICNCIFEIDEDGEFHDNLDLQSRAQTCSYATTLNNLGDSIHYVSSGADGLILKVCQGGDCALNYAIKIFNPSNAKPGNEIHILRTLNEKVLLTNLSPHIILYIQDFECKGIPMLWFKGVTREYDDYYKRELKNTTSHVLIFEFAENGNLLDYIGNLNVRDMTIIYFQILYTLLQIKSIFPRFRHRDLHSANILLQKDDNFTTQREQYYVYRYSQSYYLIPVLPILIKISDFERSTLQAEAADEYENFDLNNFLTNFLVKLKCISKKKHNVFRRIITLHHDLIETLHQNEFIRQLKIQPKDIDHSKVVKYFGQ